MADLTHHVPLTFAEALAAIRRFELDPDELPVRVVAAAVRRAADPAGPSRREVDRWSIPSASGAGAGELADLVGAARTGRLDAAAAVAVRDRYGLEGLVAGISLAAMLAAESRDQRVAAGPPSLQLTSRLGTGLLGLSQQLHRSFGVIPGRWRVLAVREGAALRWWDVHEGAMAPHSLTGEEKWLAMAALADEVGDRTQRRLYGAFLVRNGWTEEEVEAGLDGRTGRLRAGYSSALRGVRRMLGDGLDRRRVELAGADLPAVAVAELVDLARLTRALTVLGLLA